MEGNIFIYGDIYPDQSSNAVDFGVVSLKTVTEQINAQKGAETFVVHIHSRGGDVNEGWAIHDALIATGKEIVTINEGMVGSIATVPYLSAKKENRRSLPNAKTFIHNPWGGLMGDAKEISKYGEDLKKEEDKLAQFYADQTGGDIEDIKAKMDQESEFTAEEAKALGFVGSISEPLRAVAKYTPKKQPNNSDMSDVKEQMKEHKTLLDKILGKLGMNKKALAYTLDNGDTVETDSEDTLAEGQVVTLAGTPVGEGTYTLEDGTTFATDAAGVVTSVTVAETDEMDALKTENEALKAEIDSMKAEAKKNTDLLNEVKADVAAMAKLQSTYKPKVAQTAFKKDAAAASADTDKEKYNAIKEARKAKRTEKTTK